MSAPKRAFFALFPPEDIRSQITHMLSNSSESLSGRKLLAPDWHITLVFVGNIAAKEEEYLLTAAKDLTVTSFEITLTQMAYWPTSRVVWLGLKETPVALTQLVSALTNNLTCQGMHLAMDKHPYQPHLTLARDANEPLFLGKIDQPIRWHVNEFMLAYSHPPIAENGIRYTVRNRFSLQEESHT